MPADVGDHSSIQQLLAAVFAGASRDQFLASLDDPFYEPHDRLVVKQGDRVVSHVHLLERVMHLGSLQLPVRGLCGVATLAEFRGRGFANHLLKMASRAMVEEGAAIGYLKTRIPHFFRPAGWAVCGRHSFARAGSRDLLAQLASRKAGPAAGILNDSSGEDPLPWLEAAPPVLSVRPWRQVELPAIMRIYQQSATGSFGSIDRTEAYWRWLISHQGFDQIYVAVLGPDRFEFGDVNSPIVGYCITRQDRIIELMAPGQPTAAQGLLARACSEAIERDYHTITLHTAANDRLLELFRAAHGVLHQHESQQGEVQMVKIHDPLVFLRTIASELHARASAAGLTRPCELGLLIEGQKYRLTISRRSVKAHRCKIGRSYLSCNLAEFARLVLGHLDLDEAIAHGRLETSTRIALETARVLFPRMPLWHSPLDE